MGFLEYSNQTHSNIIPKKEFEDLTKEVFGVIAENLGKSLGPLGSSATILDGMMTEATKDGYAILKKYRFHNRYKKMIYNLILAPCTRVNNTVGDATTTVICLTNALFNRYQGIKDYFDGLYRLPRHFTKAWDEVVAELIEYVKQHTTQIDPNDWNTIYNLAYVVSNGNAEVSKAIADTYQAVQCPNIKEKDSPTNKSYISPINGFDFPAHLIADAFARNDDMSVKEHDIAVMVLDHKLEMDVFNSLIVPLNDVLRAMGKKLLILAPYYDKVMIETTVSPYLNMEMTRYGAFNLIMAQFELGKLAPHQMTDLAIVLRGKALSQDLVNTIVQELTTGVPEQVVEKIFEDDQYKLYHFIGVAEDAMLSCVSGSIFKVKDIDQDPAYQDALNRARMDLESAKAETPNERQSYAAKIYEANSRIMQLEMKNYIYYVGADSSLQKQIIWDSIEDVIKCLRSAIKYGVVPGCQLTLIKGCTDIISKIVEYPITDASVLDELDTHDRLKVEITSLIYSALRDVYSMVLHGGDGMGMIKLQPRWQYTTKEGTEELKKEAVAHGQRIINESIEKMQVYDIENLEFSDKIITSAETDTMVLSAASELVKILISGNQCIVLDSDVDESHQEEVQAYV